MYDKYEHGNPKVVLSVGKVMGLYLHMVQGQPRVTYAVILWYNDLDIWLCMSIISCNEWYCIMTMFRDYSYGDVVIFCALMNYMWVAYDLWFSNSFKMMFKSAYRMVSIKCLF